MSLWTLFSPKEFKKGTFLNEEEEEYETVDQKRNRYAKKILSKLKQE